ncbi:MAG TPA: ScyD/ScyE family protein [Puia sp.]|nr:ScyD/ScyE family protein [Puia sp.]
MTKTTAACGLHGRHALPLLLAALTICSCQKKLRGICNCSPGDYVTTTTVFSTGFNNPRGLKFGPDGYLYVAEAGIGGSNPATCTNVLPPVGPYTGSDTGARISRVSPGGTRTTWVTGLPSSQTAPTQGSLVSGVGDIAFIGNTLYGILAGAGCSHGVADIPNGVVRVNSNHSWTGITDLSAFQQANPVAHPNPPDFEPDGTWYSMIAVGNDLYAVEPNHGELDRITPKGAVSRVIDISAAEGHIVPTAITWHKDAFYVGNLDIFPIVAGSASVYRITPGGSISVYATGFTTIVGVLFDQLGGLYVLENTTGNAFPTPGTGDIVRVDPSGVREIIASGLNLPTAMTMGPDNKIYVSVWGFGGSPGMGEIDVIDISCSKQVVSVK